MAKYYSHFSVGECGELFFTKGTMGKIFDLWENRGNGAMKNGYFVPFFSDFPPIVVSFLSYFVSFSSTTFSRNPPQPTSRVPCSLFSHTPPPFSPNVPPFPPFFLQTPKSWFGGLVSSVAVRANACSKSKTNGLLLKNKRISCCNA